MVERVASFVLVLLVVWITKSLPSAMSEEAMDNALLLNESCILCFHELFPQDTDVLLHRFIAEDLCDMCRHMLEWKRKSDASYYSIDDRSVIHWTTSQRRYLDELFVCRGEGCIARLPGASEEAREYGPAVRKEIRLLTDQERMEYFRAVRQLKEESIDGVSLYDLFVEMHHPNYSAGAHEGPAFIPFHREYLKIFETALRKISPRVGIPYWDSSLEEGLPDVADSILWSATFMGTARGPMTDGPFEQWKLFAKLPGIMPDGGGILRREVNRALARALYNPDDISLIRNFTSYKEFDECWNAKFEAEHNMVHLTIGGQMGKTETAPNDPLFYSHHAFVDEFRRRQHPLNRTVEYSPANPNCSRPAHRPYEIMRPFYVMNLNGLSDSYDAIAIYDDPPVCALDMKKCEPSSAYIFCDTSRRRCLSKVNVGGNCTGLESQDSCYESVCTDADAKRTKPDLAETHCTDREDPSRQEKDMEDCIVRMRDSGNWPKSTDWEFCQMCVYSVNNMRATGVEWT